MEFGRNFSRKKLFLAKNTFFQGTYSLLYQCQFSRKIRGTLSSPCKNNDMWQKHTFSSCIPRKMFLTKHAATPVKSTLNHCRSTLNYGREIFFGMSLASSIGTPSKVKLETSHIDFDDVREPPIAPAIPQSTQTTVA
ncbi:hypothetical protein MTR_4g025560 [Medicago truncatula]|uniref:Uncharacterized protein n=1 Tax=Medicago truncatula TaxID=3880 RepID=A0A072UH77_MEDTR|nr:hypothetical protein MTR_4g025560 [Medicago truncatula]